MRIFFRFAIVAFILLLVLFSTFFISQKTSVDSKDIVIKKGSSTITIAKLLEREGLIKSSLLFRLMVKFRDAERKLYSGRYHFDGELDVNQVLDILIIGQQSYIKVTLPEGLTLDETIELLVEKKLGDFDKFTELAYDSLFIRKHTGFKVNSIEGFLYPETYHIPDHYDEEQILAILTKQFRIATSKVDYHKRNNMTSYEILILASIVESEAVLGHEKPMIASVYLNRLRIGYKLQADPTVAYVLEKMGKKRKKIYFKDLEVDSPYNTYKYEGLPPTPICNPAVSSIEAIINPAKTNFLYFVANGSGGHSFSRNFKQHLQKQKRIRQKNAQ